MADDEQFELSGDLEDSNFGSGIDSASFGDSGFGDSFVDNSAEIVDDAVLESPPPTGQTSAEVGNPPAGDVGIAPTRKGILTGFSLFDAMLVMSFLLICAASVLMLLGLGDYGGLTNAWRTTDITVK